MTIYIDLGTKVAINIAIQTYIEYALNKEDFDKEVVMNTIEGIFIDEKLQRYWIEKKFPQKKIGCGKTICVKEGKSNHKSFCGCTYKGLHLCEDCKIKGANQKNVK